MEYIFWILSFHYLIFVSVKDVLALKCRTGNQQSDEQLSKIMQVCRRRYQGYDREYGYNTRDTDSQESSDSDSSEELFDNRFLTGGSGSNRYRGNNYNNNGRDYNNQQSRSSSSSSSMYNNNNQNGRNWRTMNNGNNGNGMMSNGYDNNMGSSRGSMYSVRTRSVRSASASGSFLGYNNGRGYSGGSGSGGYDGQGGYGSSSSGRSGSNYGSGSRSYYGSGSGNGNGNGNYNDEEEERERACIIQCFFNELNLVDQRGYPERSAVTGIMIRNIQDPELRDFVEESIYECYHYLNNGGRQEKCEFSQNLLTCLSEKGSEILIFLEM